MGTDVISVVAIGSFSPLGDNPSDVWEQYQTGKTLLSELTAIDAKTFGGLLPNTLSDKAEHLKRSNPHYKNLDKSVLYAMLASRAAIARSGWDNTLNVGVNIGSSRGATDLFEQYHSQYLETGKAAVQASPATTLGNIASWVAQDIKTSGPEISHSITCSTALHAMLNGVAWLKSGMSQRFLVGGSEAPLTGFTIAQMRAMKIYSYITNEFPCRALDLEKELNTMVLGEGAAVACLESGYREDALAYITGVGYATEVISHGASLSTQGNCLQASMRMALGAISATEVDAVVMHAPGTVKGDLAEYNAVKAIFGDNMPLLTTNKWKIGHTFGASGLLSLEMAAYMLQHNAFIPSPFYKAVQNRELKNILVNAVGFGGNAVSILISKSPR